MNDKQSIDEMVSEYGMRLAELESMFYDLYGIYPFFDCTEFWEDRAVVKIETLLDFWWGVKKTLMARDVQ